MAQEHCDFAALKRATNIEYVAGWLGLDSKKAGEQLRSACPVTGGGDRALVITPEKGVWYCFSPHCKRGGDLIELVAHVHKISTREAALSLQKHLWSPQGKLEPLEYLIAHESVQAIGLPAHIATALGAGYAPKGILAGRVALPLRKPDGTLVCYVGIGLDLEPLVKFPKRFFV